MEIRYERNDLAFERNKFRVRGDSVEIFPVYSHDKAIRVEFFGDEIDRISEINVVTGNATRILNHVAIYPASHYVTTKEKMEAAIERIRAECDERVKYFEAVGKLIEAQRIRQRTDYDIEMMQELGYCSGIENYSRVISNRAPGSPPMTLLDYFPKDFLLFVDESHVTLPQVRAMYRGDRARKDALVEYGFRLPSAYDNRPLMFDEFEQRIHQRVYVSATPGQYERERAGQLAEQIIRPTGLLDPEMPDRPAGSGDLCPAHRRPDRRPHRRDQRKDRPGTAQSGHDPDQEDGGGSLRVPLRRRNPDPLYAPRHRDHRTHGDHPRPARRGL